MPSILNIPSSPWNFYLSTHDAISRTDLSNTRIYKNRFFEHSSLEHQVNLGTINTNSKYLILSSQNQQTSFPAKNNKSMDSSKRGPRSLWLPGRRINYELFIIAYEKGGGEPCTKKTFTRSGTYSSFQTWQRDGGSEQPWKHISTSAHSGIPCRGPYRIASSNTLFRLRCVSAEHSRYLCARISLATPSACSYETASIFRDRRASMVARSSRRSSLVPTRMMGTLGAWCSISGNHYNGVNFGARMWLGVG